MNIGFKYWKADLNVTIQHIHKEINQNTMGSACTTESRSPSPVYGRNGVILKRPASVTSYELKMEKMRAEVEQVY